MATNPQTITSHFKQNIPEAQKLLALVTPQKFDERNLESELERTELPQECRRDIIETQHGDHDRRMYWAGPKIGLLYFDCVNKQDTPLFVNIAGDLPFSEIDADAAELRACPQYATTIAPHLRYRKHVLQAQSNDRHFS